MNQRQIYDQELFARFVTFSCYRRRRLLDHDQPKRIVLGMLEDQLRRQSATCVGFVVMLDHVHALVWFPKTGQLSLVGQDVPDATLQLVETGRAKLLLSRKLPKFSKKAARQEPRPPMKSDFQRAVRIDVVW